MANQASIAQARILDADGVPVAGALVYFYASGTTSLIDVYNADGAVVENPLEADANGAVIQAFVTETAKVVAKTALGETLYTLDPVPTTSEVSYGAAQVTFTPTSGVPYLTVQAAIEGVDVTWRAAFTGAGIGTIGDGPALANINATNIPAGMSRVSDSTTGTFPNAEGTPITAGSFVVSTEYIIQSIGTTDFTLIGAASNTVGVTFTASGAGTGTGTASAITEIDPADGGVARMERSTAGTGYMIFHPTGMDDLYLRALDSTWGDWTRIVTEASGDARYIKRVDGVKKYTSPEQTITSNAKITLAHGLGVVPVIVQWHLVCLTSEQGYSVGDIICVDLNGSTDSVTRISTIEKTATNLVLHYSQTATVFSIPHKTTGNIAGATHAYWAVVVTALG